MDKKAWIGYVNRHIDRSSGLPVLAVESLERWERLELLVPEDGNYSRTDIERTLALLMLERSIEASASNSSEAKRPKVHNGEAKDG